MKLIHPPQIMLASMAAVLAALSGCSAQTPRPANTPYTAKYFNAPLDTRLSVNTGDSIFVAGSYIDGEVIDVDDAIDLMVPGALRIPFPVHIERGSLELTRIDGTGKYYCAKDGSAAATFPGLGSVIAKGDCVGIRISMDQSERKWVVDNSVHNGSRTIWEKRMDASDLTRYRPRVTATPFKVQSLRRITFDGYFAGQLHFTWEEIASGSRETKEFTFDFSGSDALIGIKGNRFRALAADNVSLTYSWVAFEGS